MKRDIPSFKSPFNIAAAAAEKERGEREREREREIEREREGPNKLNGCEGGGSFGEG